MDPTTIFCPNPACPARGQGGQGNIGIHSRKDKRFICTECRKTFTATKGTAFYRLRTPAETVALVLTLLAHGCPLQAIVVAFGYDERTVAAWEARAGRQGQAVQEQLVEQPRDLGHVQADEIRVKTQGGIVWMALAMMVKTRLWLAGEVSEHRDMPLIRQLIERVRRCAVHRPLLCCTDGLCAYIRAIRETFRDATAYGGPGTSPAASLAQRLRRAGRQALCAAAGCRCRAAHRGGYPRTGRDASASLARGRGDQHRLHRAAQRDLSGAPGIADPPRPGPGTPHGDLAARDVSDRHGV